jgi:conjugal transfer pilus assembly protein TraL
MDKTDYSSIPSRLDDLPKFLWWDFDVALLAMTGMVFGFVSEHIIVATAIGFGSAALYQRSKSGKHRAFGLHLLYWYTPIRMGMKATPPSAIREYIG